jgi:site-specific recombinase
MPHKLKSQMFNALKILSYRVAALGLEKEINRKMLNGDELLSPFLLQNKEVYDLIMLLSTGLSSSELQDRFNNITELLHQCEINLAQIKEKTSISGTSLQQIFVITRIAQMLERMKTIIGLMDDANFKTSQLVSFFKKTIHTENNKNKLRELFSENISLLSYQIAEHKSQSGEHYIAQDRNEYLKFFYSACGGGIIISFVVLLKVMIHHAGYAPFWEAVMYSLNYAMGFILIHITGSTLATKQPAMTASTIARSLDIKASGRLTDETIALLFAKVFNTQTISFIGNLVMVFPLTALWVMLLETSTGKLFVTPNEAVAMLDANNPLRSLVWLYAAFTGFFLFLSGIISGYYDNKVVYEQIPQRIRHHPHLQKMLPEKILSAFANYMNHNMGSLLGNLALGFFLGTATFIGEILGWYYDIRHITISSGYFSIGVFEIHSILPWWEIAVVFIGVMGVGFVNFVVSFSLALYVALKSRNVSVKDYTNLVATILRYFFRYPMDFIIPPAQERRITEIEGKDYLNK